MSFFYGRNVMFYVKSVLVITGTISYQFWAYKYGIDTEFYCGSPGMVFSENKKYSRKMKSLFESHVSSKIARLQRGTFLVAAAKPRPLKRDISF